MTVCDKNGDALEIHGDASVCPGGIIQRLIQIWRFRGRKFNPQGSVGLGYPQVAGSGLMIVIIFLLYSSIHDILPDTLCSS